MLKVVCVTLLCAVQLATGLAVESQTSRVVASGLPTADHFLKELWSLKAREPCEAEIVGKDGFANPVNGLSKLIQPGGRLFLIGDEVVGHLCELGKPGLCCSNARPCEGASTLRTHESAWEIPMEANREGWNRLRQYALRSRSNTAVASGSAYVLNPEISGSANRSISLISSFLSEVKANEKDVMVLGLLSNHVSHSLEVYDSFTLQLVRAIVNTFPGRAVLLSSSPQHPTGDFAATAAAGARASSSSCAPTALPGEADPPMNSFQNAIFVYNVWRELTNQRARLVDVHDMLNVMASCHAVSGQCTEWKDPVVSMISQLMLDSLEKIQ